MGRLSGKTAVITGAGSGIGRAASTLFAAEGATLVIADLLDTVRETAELVTRAGGRAVALVGDAGDEAFVEGLLETAMSEFGGVDVVWANAGISGGWTPMVDQDATFWSEILRVNLIGAFLATKHASRLMIPRRAGSIILTASVAGLRSGAGCMPYSASKAGIINLATTAANELYGTGVRVNCICPGLIETGMTKTIFDGARARGNEAKLGQLNPSTRAGAAIEIAQAGLYLASDESAYVNGQAIVVDGGLSSSLPVVRHAR
jgi:NAD(P)-dependent dehydrogenase (short-subunit alcohol dehydrogenase family)